MNNRVMIGMSGGVDSAVAAYLLKQSQYELLGVTLLLYTGETACGSSENAEDARRVADRCGIPHEVVSLTEDFRKEVMDRFVGCYRCGETPNPCIDCNRYIKFGKMLELAAERSIDRIATGHYAKIEKAPDGRYLLKKAADPHKDQTYVLYTLTQHQLAHTLFPLGEYRKEEIRAIAVETGFVNAHKKDSQDICFVPDGDYAAFIERHTGETFPEGNFVDLDGNVLGTHRGIIRYTVGQRKGLGIALGKPAYVCAKDVMANTVTLGENRDLFRNTLTAHDINLIACDALAQPTRVTAKVRYGQAEQPAVAVQTEEDGLRVEFDTPQRAIAPGQSVVLYDGDTVIGGGIID